MRGISLTLQLMVMMVASSTVNDASRKYGNKTLSNTDTMERVERRCASSQSLLVTHKVSKLGILPPSICQLAAITNLRNTPTKPHSVSSPLISRTASSLRRFPRMIKYPAGEADSLALLLSAIVSGQLRDCVLVVAADQGFWRSPVMDHLLRLPNLRQVVNLVIAEDLQKVVWKVQHCRGYLLLLSDPAPLYDLTKSLIGPWDYDGRYVVAGLSREQLLALILTEKGNKTTHITGVVESGVAGQYVVLMNLLYQRERMARVLTWRASRTSTIPVNLFPDKITNLQGVVLNVATFELPPNILYQLSRNGTLIRRYGADVEVVTSVAKVFNFTIEYKESPPGEMWGEMTDNGTWNGIVGLLGTGEADIGIANIIVTNLGGRMDYQGFTSSFDQDSPCFLIKVEAPIPRWQSLALPYTGSSWLAVLLGFLLTGPLLYCLTKFLAFRDEKMANRSLVYTSLYTAGMHFRCSQFQVPSSSSLQVLVVFLWLYIIILTTGYSANLTAFLTVVRTPPGINTIKELYQSSLTVYGLGPFFGNSMAASKNKYLRGLSNRFAPVWDLEFIKSQVVKGEGVLIQALGYLNYFSAHMTTPRGEPLVKVMKECFLPYDIVLGLRSHSPLKKNFGRAVGWIAQSGLMRYWKEQALILSKKYKRELEMTAAPQSGTDTESEVEDASGVALSIEHVQGVFFILVLGYAAAVLVFLMERFSCRGNTRQ